MGKDFDFRRQPKARPIATPSKATKPVIAPPKPARTTTPKRFWPLTLLLAAAAIAGVFFYYQSLNTSSKDSDDLAIPTPGLRGTLIDGKSSPSPTVSVTPTATTITNNTDPVIQVYDGGGGKDVVNEIIIKLEGAGYDAENLQTAQFQYAKTYVYYRSAFVTEAQKIAALLANRDISLNTTVIEGAFDILIYVGKK